jgi:hypothetical protein
VVKPDETFAVAAGRYIADKRAHHDDSRLLTGLQHIQNKHGFFEPLPLSPGSVCCRACRALNLGWNAAWVQHEGRNREHGDVIPRCWRCDALMGVGDDRT